MQTRAQWLKHEKTNQRKHSSTALVSNGTIEGVICWARSVNPIYPQRKRKTEKGSTNALKIHSIRQEIMGPLTKLHSWLVGGWCLSSSLLPAYILYEMNRCIAMSPFSNISCHLSRFLCGQMFYKNRTKATMRQYEESIVETHFSFLKHRMIKRNKIKGGK